MELRKTRLYHDLASPGVGPEEVWQKCHDYISSKKDINLRDKSTGETFMHVLAKNVDKFVSAAGVTVVYLIATNGIDLDVKDSTGDTCLHKVVRVPGTHRVVVALIRCGADVTLKDSSGKTVDEILASEKPRDWEETLHWLKKFKQGVRGVLEADPVDTSSLSTLLNGWCRTSYNKGGRDVQFKQICSNKKNKEEVLQLLQEHEAKNEFVLALLAGNCQQAQLIKYNNWNIDVNTTDDLHQATGPKSPQVPRPLLAALWESDREDCVDLLLSLGARTDILYSPCNISSEKEPLFFFLVCEENRPSDNLVHKILFNSDMAARNQKGQTILFKAINYDYTEQFIRALFKYGVNIASRDCEGRTARDFAEAHRKTKYLHVLDEHVVNIVKESNLDKLYALVLQGYDHILDVTDSRGLNLTHIIRENCSLSRDPRILRLLEKITAIQDHLEFMFRAADSGFREEVKRYISRKFAIAQDRCGRSVLHRAILAKSKPVIRFLIDEYPHILNIQDNMGRTALHYAYLLLDSDSTLVQFLTDRGADDNIRDVAGKRPVDYSCEVCEQRTYIKLRSDVEKLSMKVYLSETNFEKSLNRAIRKGDLARVKNLIEGLKERGDINRYTDTLFQCIDSGRQNIAVYLIRNGMRTDIYKQYQTCSPSSSACAMYACDHSVTSFRERATQLDCYAVLETMDEIALEQAQVQSKVTKGKPQAMEQLGLLGLL